MALPGFATSRLGVLQTRLNLALVCGYVVIAFAVVAPFQEKAGRNPSLFGTAFLSLVGWQLMSGIQRLIDRFEPASALEAKRLNEQIKILATMMNTIAAASVSVLAIAEIAKKPAEPNMLLITGAVGIGLWVNMGARGLLLHLKDDAASAYPEIKQREVTADAVPVPPSDSA